MAYKIKPIAAEAVTINAYEVDLFGTFEGKYLLEETEYTDRNGYRSYTRNPVGVAAAQVENMDIHRLIVDNYIQWRKESKNHENTI